MTKISTLGVAALTFSAYLFTGSANATTITLDGYNGPDPNIMCTPSCSAFTGPNPGLIQLSETDADAYPKQGSESGELALLNDLLVQFDPARATVNFVDKKDVEEGTRTTNRRYFSLKQGNDMWFFENTSGGEVTITAMGDDWSHSTVYGPVVPLPAAAWLFGSALIGLVSIGRRKRS